jgi:hypothetical protein
MDVQLSGEVRLGGGSKMPTCTGRVVGKLYPGWRYAHGAVGATGGAAPPRGCPKRPPPLVWPASRVTSAHPTWQVLGRRHLVDGDLVRLKTSRAPRAWPRADNRAAWRLTDDGFACSCAGF